MGVFTYDKYNIDECFFCADAKEYFSSYNFDAITNNILVK